MGRSSSGQRWPLLADLHTGASVGLTPDPQNTIQNQLLLRYKEAIEWFGKPVDWVLVNGDAIDGTDPLGHDLTIDDPFEQAEKAAELLSMWSPRRGFLLTTGTAYHTNLQGWNCEKHLVSALQNILARRRQKSLRVQLFRKLNAKINGWFRLEARHKMSRSVVPHGRKTAPERAKYWNVINAALRSRRTGKKADWPHLCLFAHTHDFGYSGDAFGLVMVQPSWQALGSRLGDEQCSGHIDVGLVALEIGATEQDKFSWDEQLFEARMVSRVTNL